jgi:hypothetical protein
MQHPARTLRALIEDLPEAQRILSERERQRHDLIRAAGRRFFAMLGPDTFSLATFVKAIRMNVRAFNSFYCDLESLLADLIRTHLMDLFSAIGDIPQDAQDRQAARRAAYLAATRSPLGGLTETHMLLAHHHKCLPPDLREPIEQLRASLGEALAGDHAEAAFRLLDAPEFSPAEIELTLAALIADREARHQALLTRLPPRTAPATERRVGINPPPEPPTPWLSPANIHTPTWPIPPPLQPPRRQRRPQAATAESPQKPSEGLGETCRPPQTPRLQ